MLTQDGAPGTCCSSRAGTSGCQPPGRPHDQARSARADRRPSRDHRPSGRGLRAAPVVAGARSQALSRREGLARPCRGHQRHRRHEGRPDRSAAGARDHRRVRGRRRCRRSGHGQGARGARHQHPRRADRGRRRAGHRTAARGRQAHPVQRSLRARRAAGPRRAIPRSRARSPGDAWASSVSAASGAGSPSWRKPSAW